VGPAVIRHSAYERMTIPRRSDWADRVQLIDAKYVGPWELPALGAVTAPIAVLIRPDGYVAWVGEGTDLGFLTR
jgi:hypothetical protein